MDRENLTNIVLEVVKEISEDSSNEALRDAKSETLLYGDNGNLDSMSLVYLVSNLEKRLSDEFDANVVLVNKRAMSQRNSPFKTVNTLINFIEDVLKESNIQ